MSDPVPVGDGGKEEVSDMELWIVRHGQTVANRTGEIQGHSESPLDETGVLQAEMLAKSLENKVFDAVYSSDLGRAMQTAGIIARNHAVIPSRELREWHLGDWEKKNIKEIIENTPEEWKRFLDPSDSEFRPKNGESRKELFERARNMLEFFLEKYPDGKILTVTHGGFLMMVFEYLVGAVPRCMTLTNNTAVNILSYQNKRWRLVRWNDVSHLNGTLETTLPL